MPAFLRLVRSFAEADKADGALIRLRVNALHGSVPMRFDATIAVTGPEALETLEKRLGAGTRHGAPREPPAGLRRAPPRENPVHARAHAA